jgi:tartrate dehydratase beta subunit/fumarate hydratase class I family protein
MLHDVVAEPGELSPAELRAEYDALLQSVVETVGVERVVTETDLDSETVDTIAAGESVDLTVTEAAAILGLSEEVPDAEVVVLELRDHLLMGMTTGVLDVDTISAEIDADLTGQEVQQALEGRTEMTLDELAAIHRFIASAQR